MDSSPLCMHLWLSTAFFKLAPMPLTEPCIGR